MADLVLNAVEPEKLRAFLIEQDDRGFAEEVGDKWIITLPGYESRQ